MNRVVCQSPETSEDEEKKLELLTNVTSRLVELWKYDEDSYFSVFPTFTKVHDGIQITAESKNPLKTLQNWKDVSRNEIVATKEYSIQGKKIFLLVTLNEYEHNSWINKFLASILFALTFCCLTMAMMIYVRCE